MTRRERMERRAEKRLEWAKSREEKAAASFRRGREEVSGIPLGQPILVGHHSERKHRRAVERAGNAMFKGLEHEEMAKEHRFKAAGIKATLNRTIFSDDSDAVEQLEARIARLEEQRKKNNEINKIIRRKPKNEATPEKLAELKELTGVDCAKLFKKDDCGRIGVPGFENANLSARIRADKKRIEAIRYREEIQKKAASTGNGYMIEGGENRIAVTFAEKPPWEIINALKAAGFYWSSGSWWGYRKNLPEINL